MKLNAKLMTLLVITNLLTLSFLYMGCSQDDNQEAGDGGSGGEDGTITVGNCYLPATEQTEFDGLNAMLVYTMAKNYRNKQLAAINEHHFNNGNSDARSVWFDLETLKRFIHEVETKTCNECGDSSTQLGVRIYYCTYPDSAAWSSPQWKEILRNVNRDYAGMHTLMMVPTYNNGSENIDFDPQYVREDCDFTEIESFYDDLKGDPPINITLTVLAGINTTSQNHGQMIPPPYPMDNILERGAGIMYAVDRYN